jgi:hypothetical protein
VLSAQRRAAGGGQADSASRRHQDAVGYDDDEEEAGRGGGSSDAAAARRLLQDSLRQLQELEALTARAAADARVGYPGVEPAGLASHHTAALAAAVSRLPGGYPSGDADFPGTPAAEPAAHAHLPTYRSDAASGAATLPAAHASTFASSGGSFTDHASGTNYTGQANGAPIFASRTDDAAAAGLSIGSGAGAMVALQTARADVGLGGYSVTHYTAPLSQTTFSSALAAKLGLGSPLGRGAGGRGAAPVLVPYTRVHAELAAPPPAAPGSGAAFAGSAGAAQAAGAGASAGAANAREANASGGAAPRGARDFEAVLAAAAAAAAAGQAGGEAREGGNPYARFATVAPLTLPPQYHSAAPQYHAAAPQYHSAAPQYHSAAPQYHAAAPQHSAAVSHDHGADSAPSDAASHFASPPTFRADGEAAGWASTALDWSAKVVAEGASPRAGGQVGG